MITTVLPVFNKLEYTRGCLESLCRADSIENTIIVVDNGSIDGTAEYLATLPVTVVRNDTNRGYGPAVNQGIRLAKTPYVLLINNDIVVATGCLSRLLDFMNRFNHDVVSPAFRTGPLDYDLEAHARRFTSACGRATRLEVDASCVLIQSRVFDVVGTLDEQFTIGQCEDTDFFWRCRRAGFSMAMTGSAFIHHYAKVTQDAVKQHVPFDYSELNNARFREKWGRTIEGGWWERRATRLKRLCRRTMESVRYGYTLTSKGG